MKKIILLLVANLIKVSVFATPHFYISYINHTQNTGANGLTGVIGLTFFANIGDSVTLIVHEYQSGCQGNYCGPWGFNGTIIDSSGSPQIDIVVTQGGTYSTGGCIAGYYWGVTISQTTGITNFQNQQLPILKSNLVNSEITVQLKLNESSTIETSIVDINGKIFSNNVYQNVIGEFIKSESLEELANGIYFMRIKVRDDIISEKFVKSE